MLQLSNLRLTEQYDIHRLRCVAAEILGIPEITVRDLCIQKLSIDARRKPDIRFIYSLLVSVDDEKCVLNNHPQKRRQENTYGQSLPIANVSLYTPPEQYKFPYFGIANYRNPPTVIGTGPAGLFAALCLAEAGINCVILERGQPIERRIEDVERFRTNAELDPSSNIQFGEGGAGTFSDGKLTTGISDKRIRYVLERLVGFGAPEEILYLAKPHIGTDRLRIVVRAVRERLIELGCDIRFGHTLMDIDVSGGALKSISVCGDNGIYEMSADTLILALGNSARDTFEMLLRRGVKISPKSFSVGVRIEHLQRDIDFAQYGEGMTLHANLPAADYKLVTHLLSNSDKTEKPRNVLISSRLTRPMQSSQSSQSMQSSQSTCPMQSSQLTHPLQSAQSSENSLQQQGRSVYTFCVCPGGQVVSSSSEIGGVVTNGMSYHARDGENCNGALLVSVTPDDFGYEPLSGVVFQRKLEQAAFEAGGGNYCAPAQFVGDFMEKRTSSGHEEIPPVSFTSSILSEQSKPKNLLRSPVIPTYLPGVQYCNLWDVLPKFVCEALHDALLEFSTRITGFADPGALLTAVETRSSSPVRIEREGFETVGIKGIFPCGEGSGYAGGIMSSAVDGIKCAEVIASAYGMASR